MGGWSSSSLENRLSLRVEGPRVAIDVDLGERKVEEEREREIVSTGAFSPSRAPRRRETTYRLVELDELGLGPGVLLDEGPLHGLSKVLLEVVREDPLGLAELRSREGQARVLVLPQVLELL